MRSFLPITVCIALISGLCDSSRADLLDPLDFSSLTAGLDPNSTVVIDTGTDGDPNSLPSITIDGGSALQGVIDNQGGQASPGAVTEIAVFTFGGIDLSSAVIVSVSGTRALGLLSHSNATIDTAIQVDGTGTGVLCSGTCVPHAGGSGGSDGGFGLQDGFGPGGGGFGPTNTAGGGGGFGSEGQAAIGGGSAGAAYGELLSVLQGGSGGGGTQATGAVTSPVGGGGGGGAMEIGAAGVLVIGPNGLLQANGGIGDRTVSGSFFGYGGSGSGGGIRVHGGAFTNQGMIRASGADAVFVTPGSGGGGRIVASADDDTIYVGQPIPPIDTSGLDVSPGVGSVGLNHGVVKLFPSVTVVPPGQSFELGSVLFSQPASTSQPQIDLLHRDMQIAAAAEAIVPSGGYNNPYSIELLSPAASITGADPLTNLGELRGSGSIEVPVINETGAEINVINDTLVFTQAVTSNAGAQINAINSTLQFDAGLTNNGEMNLINTSIVGAVSSAVTTTATLAGSNSVSGDYEMAAGDALFIDLGGALLGEFDTLTIGGNATLAGDLNVSLDSGFSLALGNAFPIVDVTGTASGTFNGLADGALVGNFGGVPLFIDYDTSGVTLVATLASDFDLDFDVDGRDFLIWQRDPSVGLLSDWEANYGTVLPPPITASSTAVPESSTVLLFLMGSALALRSRQTRPRDSAV